MGLLSAETPTNDRVFNILLKEDELTWQNIIFDLIAKEEMDPWDIDVSLLAEKFISMLTEFKEMDFRISGKIVLAAAMFLKIKSNRLLNEDIAALDQVFNSADEPDLLDELDEVQMTLDKSRAPVLRPRTPQPRKRKVSVYDLVDALEKAMATEERRKRYFVDAPVVKKPEKSRDISLVIKDVYDNIVTHFDKPANVSLTFDELCPSNSKDDKILTFIPLLHLENQRKVDMDQPKHFGEIGIELLKGHKAK